MRVVALFVLAGCDDTFNLGTVSAVDARLVDAIDLTVAAIGGA
jgi:hypothetical protein